MFSYHYKQTVIGVLNHGVDEINARTGVGVKVFPGGMFLTVDLRNRLLPVIRLRKTFPRSAAAEVAWFVQGLRDVSFIRGYAPLWDKFVEADGTTVDAAYGYRWRSHFGRDQLALAVEALRADPTNRRVYVSAWDPSSDGLGAPGQKNVPCPVGFTLNIIGGALYSTLLIRSSDVVVGLPYDVMGHALLLDAIAMSLGVELGSMQVSISHAHIYASHFEICHTGLKSQQSIPDPAVALPRWSLAEIDVHPHDYVTKVTELAKLATWPAYNPKPEVVV